MNSMVGMQIIAIKIIATYIDFYIEPSPQRGPSISTELAMPSILTKYYFYIF